jgi:hypothetical protein
MSVCQVMKMWLTGRRRGQARSYRCEHRPVAARLAGGGALKVANAGKPDCYGFGGVASKCFWPGAVGGSLLAMAVCQVMKMWLTGRRRGQARSYRCEHRPVAARLAGGGDFNAADAGKPDCYGFGGEASKCFWPGAVGGSLLAMAVSRVMKM